ncbi:MAG TPA: ATP-dependent DNA helicase RecG [Jatrophihabitantaceae bacterium]|jgi:ATP-dependent DNA helicase RecG
MNVTLSTPVGEVVGGKAAKVLDKAFAIRTVGELLRHYPRRMAERGELTNLNELQVDEDVTVLARVIKSVVVGYGKSVRAIITVSDGTGELDLVFFGPRMKWRADSTKVGSVGMFAGRVGKFQKRRQLVHPDFELLDDTAMAEQEADMFARRLIPVYPATKDIRTWVITRCINQVFDVLDNLPEPLPAEIRARHKLLGFEAALHGIHQPDDREHWWTARRRLTWDEAFALQLVLAQRRHAAAVNPAIARPRKKGGLLDAFDARLPFELTAGQREVGATLEAELGGEHPMHRLLQGEVGSGKTIVALRAMLQAVDAGAQAALLAPTEVLAAQHARTVESMLGPLARAGQLGGAEEATRVVLLTGSLPAAARKAALLDAASGAAGIVIGTHALIQEHVQFAELGVVVVDEQHRFGVEQRDALRSKAAAPPHLLVMTATPIPRTVAMTVFGDLETSTLTELPAGRSPISTSVVPLAEKPAWLQRVWTRVREEVAAGRQAYIVCPRIGADMSDFEMEFDGLELQEEQVEGHRPPLAVSDVLPMLADGPLAGLRLAALHGRMTPDEKDLTMTDFAAGRIDVLVATTVVEVGVDVPNATAMIVLDADRFGVSQLHQLRGRVGRGGHPGVCLLVTDVPEAASARERLDAVAGTNDGFVLARLDVEQRREGDVLGSAQSGRRSQLKLLSLLRDEDLIVAARAEAADLVAADPRLDAHPLLARQVADLVGEEQASYLDKA